MHISEIIITLRKKKNLSQVELAKKVGLTQASLSNIESNKKMPHKSTIAKICDALEVPEQWFYFLALEEIDLPDNGRERFHAIGQDLQQIMLDSI
jgi:transcriptional regulator with XRE-family HTH domain